MSQYRFVPLEYVVAAHLTELFAGMEILEHHAFRVTHTRDLEVGEDVTENLRAVPQRAGGAPRDSSW